MSAYIELAGCGHMATLAARKVSEMSISDWALLLIRQKERMASRVPLSTSQGPLGRFYEIINVHEAFSTWNRATSQSLVAAFIILFYLHSLPASFIQQAHLMFLELHTVLET